MDADVSHKRHRAPQSGKKNVKKRLRQQSENATATVDASSGEAGRKSYQKHVKGSNAKGHTFSSAFKAARYVHRAAERLERKTHVPLIDRTPLEPPPVIVALVGPPKVGKTTLLQSLVKHYTRHGLNNPVGPITIVSGKKRRVTFIECGNDICSMIDVSKIADLVLLLVDASYGFEMETFEFLHMCQVHGMPRVMGVLTHLDVIKNVKKVKRTKKILKHRFWTELYQGAKLFYLSALVNDQYLKNDVKNLARFISVMRFRPLLWRTTHPYALADRMEDMTDPEEIRKDAKCDRRICLYGYVRGTHFKNKSAVHIPGVGDTRIEDMSFLPDPCPLPDKEKKRSLDQREKLLYAPFCGVGGIVYDKDAVYIDLGGSHSHKRKERKEARQNPLIAEMSTSGIDLDEQLATAKVDLFGNAVTLEGSDDEESYGEDEEETEDECDAVEGTDSEDGSRLDEDEGSTSGLFGRSDQMNPDEDDDEDIIPWKRRKKIERDNKPTPEFDFMKSELYARAVQSYQERSERTVNWMQLVYAQKNDGPDGCDATNADDDDEFGGLFKLSKKDLHKRKTNVQCEDNVLISQSNSKLSPCTAHDWSKPETLELIRDCFVSRNWLDEDGDAEEGDDAIADDTETKSDSPDDDLYGDFEDLEETGQTIIGDETSKENIVDENTGDAEGNISKETGVEESQEAKSGAEKRLEKKRKLKQMFDAEYDETTKHYRGVKEELDQQAQLNKSIFEGMDDSQRVTLEGFRPGMYVRIELANIPLEFVTNFDPAYPYIVGGLLSGEENIGFVQTRLIKHRWHERILKNRDPLIVSLGWRRFQTLPIYTIQDHNGRNRMIKYTPAHLHCHATFWGPITAQNTGLLAVQSVSDDTKSFRLAATGVVLNLDKSIQIVKKLKLTGVPFKICKKTAFIKDMFTSALEIAKFEGAALRTVSGIRGQIKKAQRSPDGAFRATFEDKILMRDMIFLRTWFSVAIPKFYAPVTSLLLEGDDKRHWEGMKTVGRLRYERDLKPPSNPDSEYKAIERRPFMPDALVVPKSLEKDLPFADKTRNPANILLPEGRQHKQAVSKLVTKHTAVVLEPHESKVHELMSMLKMVHEDKDRKEKAATNERVSKHKKEMMKLEAKQVSKAKDVKRRICRMQSKMEKRKLGTSLKAKGRGRTRNR